jgi:ankyrin repeat protein
VLQNSSRLAQLLLRNGADPNKGSSDLPPPLHLAVDFENRGFAVDLMLAGADPLKSSGNTPHFNSIMHRARPGDAPVHIACRTPPSSSCSSYEVEDSIIDMLQSLLNLTPAAPGSAAHAFEAKGRNLLYVATSNNYSRVCSWVLQQPFGPELLDTGHKAPIFAAIERVSILSLRV